MHIASPANGQNASFSPLTPRSANPRTKGSSAAYGKNVVRLTSCIRPTWTDCCGGEGYGVDAQEGFGPD